MATVEEERAVADGGSCVHAWGGETVMVFGGFGFLLGLLIRSLGLGLCTPFL